MKAGEDNENTRQAVNYCAFSRIACIRSRRPRATLAEHCLLSLCWACLIPKTRTPWARPWAASCWGHTFCACGALRTDLSWC